MEDPDQTHQDPKLEKFIANYLRCVEHPDESAIHDVRVSARRILASLDVIHNCEMTRYETKAVKRLKKLLKKLNPIRDAQVIALNASQAGNPAMDIPEFQAYLQARAEKKTKMASSIFKKNRSPEEFLKPFRALPKITSTPLEEPATALFAGVDTAYAKYLAKYQKINAEHPETIHKFRVAFKKFRYTMELASPRNAIPNVIPPKIFEDLHHMQTLLGDVQDADVMFRHYQHWYAKRQKRLNHSAPSPEVFRLDMQTKISSFLLAAPSVENYWRSNPQAPFPWDLAKKQKN